VTTITDWSRVYIVGGGTSLRGFDFDQVRDKGLLLGVNDGAHYADAHALFSLDASYARKRWDYIKSHSNPYLALPEAHEARNFNGAEHVTFYERRRGDGLAEDGRYINGVNSGFGALNLAYHKGAKFIVLLGFDMHTDDNGDIHFHEGYPWEADAKRTARYYEKWTRPFETAAKQLEKRGVEVWNASPTSRIEAFPKCGLEDLC